MVVVDLLDGGGLFSVVDWLMVMALQVEIDVEWCIVLVVVGCVLW